MNNEKVSSLENIGVLERQKHVTQRRYNINDEYNLDVAIHDDVRGKGTPHPGHGATIPKPYNEATKNVMSEQLDIYEGGNIYDIKGRIPGNFAGREYLVNLNLYGPEHKYGPSTVEISDNIEAQFTI